MSQLKKLKQRMTKGQLQHRKDMKKIRKLGFQVAQEKDRWPNFRIRFEGIG